MLQLNQKKITGIIAVLVCVACLAVGCSRGMGNGSDTDPNTPQTEARVPPESAPEKPVVTETQVLPGTPVTEMTEPAVTAEPETEPPLTEALPETETDAPETVVPETETEIPVTELPPAEEPIPPVTAPAVPTPKPVIDLSESIAAGEDVRGQLTSTQSEHIRLVVDYAFAWTAENEYVLTLEVGLTHYELWCSERTAGGSITVDGVQRTFASPAIAHEAHEQVYTPFFTQTYNCTDKNTASVDVSWAFNGTYGGAQIGTLSTGAILQWTLPDRTEAPDAEPAPAETEAVGELSDIGV